MRAVRRWRRAIRQIVWLLGVRRRWAATGRYLQRPQVLALTAGLERRQGVLHRVVAADAAIRRRAAAKPKAKGQPSTASRR